MRASEKEQANTFSLFPAATGANEICFPIRRRENQASSAFVVRPNSINPAVFVRIIFASIALLLLASCSSTKPSGAKVVTPNAPKAEAPIAVPVSPSEHVFPVMLGIDVLEAEGFTAIRGKRIGLLTHRAGVNRRGESTIEILHHAPGVQLVVLFAAEHGLYNDVPAEKPVQDTIDPKTGLKVISLYQGKVLKPTPAQLRLIDALVIDLQDIGTRSYTFSGAMKTAMEACWESRKEVIVLDRPNPLGGLKVDGPMLDANQMSDVGRFLVPYVHGLTIGELATLVQGERPANSYSKLTVIPMHGWVRSMRWPETGLKWVPTSSLIPDFEAVQGYPMTGLGCILSGFRSGVGKQFPFRGISHPSVNKIPDVLLEKELGALKLPGLQFHLVKVPSEKSDRLGTGIHIEIADYDAWQPTELSFYLMKLACKLEPRNPFAAATNSERHTFLVHVGSEAFFRDLVTKGKDIDIEMWLRTWRDQARIYQEQSKRYWLYH